jgi:hypothetical protein
MYKFYPTAMGSSRYFISFGSLANKNDNKVIPPILPNNIVIINKILLKLSIYGVIPKDKPTVPKADTVSNNISLYENFEK